MSRYAPIRSPYWLLRDGDEERLARLHFHIEQGDYFPFLATVIAMLGDTVARCEGAEAGSMQVNFVEEMRKDLLYLHERYDITPRKKQLAYTKEKMVRFDP